MDSFIETNIEYLERVVPECERRILQKQQLLDDVKNELDLLRKQEFDLLKSKVQYWQFGGDQGLLNVLHGFQIKNNENSSDEAYHDIEAFKEFDNKLKKVFNVYSLDITNMVEYNYGEAVCVEFTYQGRNWCLTIPIVAGISKESYSFEKFGPHCFKLALHIQADEYFRDEVGATFDVDKLKYLLQEGVDRFMGRAK